MSESENDTPFTVRSYDYVNSRGSKRPTLLSLVNSMAKLDDEI